MAPITWDALEDRTYEEGVDRGVLYPIMSQGVPWNGLVSVNEKNTSEAPLAHIFDGVKFFEQARAAKFEATLTAFTYPLEFEECDGSTSYEGALLVAQQPPQAFGLSYRTRIGSYDDPDAAYRIHVIYNALAQPTDRNQGTRTNAASPSLFSWDITTTPVESLSLYPSAHYVIDSRFVESANLQALEDILYGATSEPRLPTVSELRTLAAASNDPWRFDPTRGSVFKKAFGKFRTKPIDILAVGDSTTEGYGASAINTRWVNLLGQSLRTLTNQKRGGEGYVPAFYATSDKADRFAGGTFITSNAMYGLGLRHLQLSAGTISFSFYGTGCDILFVFGSGTGQYRWRIDGGAWSGTNSSYSATTTPGVVGISPRNLARGNHTIEIERLTLTLYIEGAMVYDGDEEVGIRVIEGAHAGWSSYLFGNDPNMSVWMMSMTQIGVPYAVPNPTVASVKEPPLVIVGLGMNDYGTPVTGNRRTAAQHQADLIRLCGGLRTELTVDPTILLICPWKMVAVPPAPLSTWDEYRQAYFNAAQAAQVGIVDVGPIFGDLNQGDPNGYTIGDGVHLNDKGQRRLFEEIQKALFTP